MASERHFLDKTYSDEALPAYAESREKLPVPILDDNPGWIEMYWRCWELAFSHLKKPSPGSKLVSNFMDEAFNENIFQWDTIFMVMFGCYMHHVFPVVKSLDNFYASQHEDGFICREIRESDGSDYHAEASPQGINPPLFAWAEVQSFRVTGDTTRLKCVLPVLEKYASWLENNRRSPSANHGLYWQSPLGSGMDNSPRSGSGWVDMSAQMAMLYDDMSIMAEVSHDSAKAHTFRVKAQTVADGINKWMWDETDGLYYDIDDQGKQIKSMTAACFWPLVAGVVPEGHSDRVVQWLTNPKTFWRIIPFPTLSANQLEYDSRGGYWLGSVWAPTNMMIIKGLAKCGYEQFAAEASERYLAGIYEVFKKTGTFWENYSPDSYEQGSQARPDFVGWTGDGPIALLIENVIGLQCDAAHNRMIWRLRRTDRNGLRNLHLGASTVSVVCTARESENDPAEVAIESSKSIELVLIHPEAKKHVRLKAGKHSIRIP
jgi:glycogen debranching enzyme